MTGLEELVKDAEVQPSAAPKKAPPRSSAATTSAIISTEEDTDIPLYAARRKIYPQSVQGLFRRIKWAVLLASLAIYYLLPFVRWDRGPNAPSQAVLIDFSNRRFYFFFIEIWPQEVYYLTGLLIIAAHRAVPDERRRRPYLVRLSLPADRVDRPILHHRALDGRRPPRAHAARCATVDRRDLRAQGR